MPVKGRPRPGAEPAFVQEPSHGARPLVLQEELVEENPDGCFLRIREHLVAVPAVPERGVAPETFPELRPHRNRGRHPLGDLFALPLRHGGDHGVEESAGGGRSVDRLLEGDEVRALVPEIVGEVEELSGVPGEARELGEDQGGDLPGLHVREHPLGLRMLLD